MATRMAGRFASRARPRPQFQSRFSGQQQQRQHFQPSPPRFSFEESRFRGFRIRRELVSLLPLHNATASSRLVSLISGGSESLECWLQHCPRSINSVASHPSRNHSKPRVFSPCQPELSFKSETITIREGVGFSPVLAMAAGLVAAAGRVASPPARVPSSNSARVNRPAFAATSRCASFRLEQDGLSSSGFRSSPVLSPVPKRRDVKRISLGTAVLRNFQGFEYFGRLKDDG